MSLLALFYVCINILTYVVTNSITYNDVRGTPYKVGYDHRAITINGVRTMLISGAIHYPRSTPGMWPYLMKMAKNQGLNAIQSYVFWNIHKQKEGVLDFSGCANLSRYLEDAADAGLFVYLRVGPFVAAE
jgi:beta-galactosidase GanA